MCFRFVQIWQTAYVHQPGTAVGAFPMIPASRASIDKVALLHYNSYYIYVQNRI